MDVARSLIMEVKALGSSMDSHRLKGNDAMALFLIRKAKIDVDTPTCGKGGTPLMLAAFRGMLEVVRCMVKERGADVHAIDEDGVDVT